MNGTFWTLVFVGLAGVGCAALHSMIGVTVDDDGMLREAFALVPLGWLLMIIGFGGAFVHGLLKLAGLFLSRSNA